MNREKIGSRLIALRGKTPQSAVANSCGISVSALSMYEQGNRIPRDEIKVALAGYYEKTVQELFFE